jgi:hypothetical protein
MMHIVMVVVVITIVMMILSKEGAATCEHYRYCREGEQLAYWFHEVSCKSSIQVRRLLLSPIPESEQGTIHDDRCSSKCMKQI